MKCWDLWRERDWDRVVEDAGGSTGLVRPLAGSGAVSSAERRRGVAGDAAGVAAAAVGRRTLVRM